MGQALGRARAPRVIAHHVIAANAYAASSRTSATSSQGQNVIGLGCV